MLLKRFNTQHQALARLLQLKFGDGSRIIQRTISSSILSMKEEVQDALRHGKPVVALESTIVAHGMPYPQNLELAIAVEEILRRKGCVPATIAIQDGCVKIGLSSEELEDLAKSGEEGRAKKCSTRDLPRIIKQQQQPSTTTNNNGSSNSYWGATTVASTMKLANQAGISTFVTGGIGGVHRGATETMDISADLIELSKTPVVVVSAGIKSILDIPKTLEVLETHGVPTFGWRCDEFPAFFSPTTSEGVRCPARIDTSQDVASAYWVARSLQMPQGMLVAVPNQDPAGDNVEKAIQSSLRDAEELDIKGAELTPFILKNVANITQGDSLRSNMALVKANALVGADIAIAIAEAATSAATRTTATTINKPTKKISKNLCILQSNSGELHMSPLSPDFSPVGDDTLKNSDILILDGSLKSMKEQSKIAKQAIGGDTDVMLIPSGVKSVIAAHEEHKLLSRVKYAILDVEELLAISDGWTDTSEDIEYALHDSDYRTLKRAVKRTLDQMFGENGGAYVVVMMGDKGLMIASKGEDGGQGGRDDSVFQHLPSIDKIGIYKGTAASDCLCGAFVHGLLEGRDAEEAAVEGYNAVVTLLSDGKSTYPFLSQYGVNT